MGNIDEKIAKIKELAERGYDGEKQNAIQKLKELEEKYKKEKKYLKSFKLVDYQDCKDIMVHCILDVDKNASIEGSKQKKELYCKLTNKEYNQVCEKFNKYYPQYLILKDNLLKNFIINNNLGITL